MVNRFLFTLVTVLPLGLLGAAVHGENPAVFNKPVSFYCDLRTIPTFAGLQINTTPLGTAEGDANLTVDGELDHRPFEGYYVREGKKLVRFFEYRPVNRTLPGRNIQKSGLEPFEIFQLTWNGKNSWTASMAPPFADRKFLLHCTDSGQ